MLPGIGRVGADHEYFGLAAKPATYTATLDDGAFAGFALAVNEGPDVTP